MSAKNRLVDCVSDKITVNTMSGNTEITENGTVKSVSYSAMSGNLTVDADGIEELTAKTMSGDISLNLKKADFTLKLTGATASLEASGINYEITEEKAYKFGDGNGKITVDCASGKVSVTVK